jgi:acyl-coenzyme A thioesterase 13
MDKLIGNRLKLYEGEYFTQSKSAAGKWLNYKLLEVNDTRLKASLIVREEMTNPSKQLHGGIYALICDELCGLAFYNMGYPTFYTTVNLHVDYLRSAILGEEIIASAKVIRAGKRIAYVTCDLYNTLNEHLAHATTNLINTNKAVFELDAT